MKIETTKIGKRISAVLLTGVLALSFTACGNGDDKNTTSDGSVASSASTPSEAQPDVVELDERIKEPIENAIGADVLGNKTKTFLNNCLSDELDISVSVVMPETEESSQSMMGLPAGSKISFDLAKNADNDVRLKMNLAGIKMDMLKNGEGSYILSEDNKTALFTKVEEESSTAESSVDIDSAISSYVPEKDAVKNAGDGEEEFGDGKYSYEAYTIKYDPSSLSAMAGSLAGITESGTSSQAAKEQEYTMKLYFDGDKLKGFSMTNGTDKVDINVDKFETQADASLFTVPEDYEVTEDTTGMGFLGMLAGGAGTTASIPEE